MPMVLRLVIIHKLNRCSDMLRFLKTSGAWALTVITFAFTFVPETLFGKCKFMPESSVEANIILNRVLAFIAVIVLSVIINAIYLFKRRSIHIKGKNYSICIKYGDIFKMSSCKKVISFDECFTTVVGSSPSEINPDSICGQYLRMNPITDVQCLIDNAQVRPCAIKSKFQDNLRYDSGRLVPNGNFLLLSFAKLDEDGLGRLTRDEFLDSLSLLWKEINKHYGQKDVCIPILGSGVTRMDDVSLTQQELLDIIIGSYKLSAHKIKLPYQLYIVCEKRDDFSLNKIGEYI